VGDDRGSRASGLILQGIAFGLAHGYQGKAMLTIMVQRWVLGLLAIGAGAYDPECSRMACRTAPAVLSHL
jgi:hypothetical protein